MESDANGTEDQRLFDRCVDNHSKDTYNFVNRLNKGLKAVKYISEVRKTRLMSALKNVDHVLNEMSGLRRDCESDALKPYCLNRCIELRHGFNKNIYNFFQVMNDIKEK